MKLQKTVIAASIVAAVGVVGMINTASAAGVAAGIYNLVITTTPTQVLGTSVATAYNFGVDANWKSSFTFGGVPPNAASQAMTDSSSMVASLGGPRGSSIGGDTFAGILGITVASNGSYTVNGVAGMGGTISTTGAMTLNVTGRLGAVSGFPSLYDERWNVDNCTFTTSGTCTNNGNTVYQSFSTGSATTFSAGGPATINGKAIATIADVNADGFADYKGILVSGGQVGSDFGGFFGAGYLEVWNIQLRTTTAGGLHTGYNVDTIAGTAGGDFAQYVNAVPVPAAAWLFGSGLVGLVGVARRKKS